MLYSRAYSRFVLCEARLIFRETSHLVAPVILRQSIPGSVSIHNTAHRMVEPCNVYLVRTLSVLRSTINSQWPATMANPAQFKGVRAALLRASRIFSLQKRRLIVQHSVILGMVMKLGRRSINLHPGTLSSACRPSSTAVP